MTGSAAASAPARPRRLRARRLAPTALFAALAAYTVARSAQRFAYSDDFDLVLGRWPPSAAWLWAQHLEHRLPLPKLLLALLARHGDFRGGVWLSWALVAAASAWLVARIDRGPLVAVLVPALLLCPANNAWRWDVELQFTACVALAVVALAHALSARGVADAAVVALASLLLPLTGGNGLILSAAPLVASLALAADGARPGRARAVFALGAVATLAVDVAYLHGWAPPPAHAALHARSFAALAAMAAHVVVAPLGSLAESERAVAVAAPLVAAGLAAAAVAIAVTRGPRRIVLASFFAGSAAVVVAIAVTRAGRGWPALEAHYASAVAPLYVVALVALAPTPDARAPSTAALTVAVALTVAAALFALAYVPTTTLESRARARAFVADCGSAPPAVLAARYLPLFYWIDTPEVRARVAAYVATLDCAALRR